MVVVRPSLLVWLGAATIIGAVVLNQVLPWSGNSSEKKKEVALLTTSGNKELDNHFVHAAKYVAASKNSSLSNEDKLVLYAFYKQATSGDCKEDKPSAVDFVAKAKWDAWVGIRGMSTAEAMKRYLEVVSSMYPGYSYGSELPIASEDSVSESESDNGGDIGLTPLMSQVVVDKTTDEWKVVENEFHFAKNGQMEAVEELLAANSEAINSKDNDGRTMLHWAVDRDQNDVVLKLLKEGADVNSTDSDGMTPLHYAVNCEYVHLIDLLLQNGADVNIADNDGETPLESASSAIRAHISNALQSLNK